LTLTDQKTHGSIRFAESKLRFPVALRFENDVPFNTLILKEVRYD